MTEHPEATQPAQETAGQSGPGRQERVRGWKKFLLLGPAIIVGALQFGPGNTVSAAVVGAQHGFNVIWLIALSSVLMLVYTDMGVRIGMASKTTSVATIKEVIGRPIGLLLGASIFVIACLFMTGSLVGASLGLVSLFGANVKVWTIVCAMLMVAVILFRNAYRSVERLLIGAVAVMVIVFAITAIMAQPNWLDVGQGFIPGPISGGSVAVFAVLGTNLSVYAAFYATYTIREKGTGTHDYRSTTLVDTLPGVIIPGIMTIFIIIAGATVLRGETLESADDIAGALAPSVGAAASYIFAIGIFAAGFSSIVGNFAAGGTVFGDGLDRGYSLNTPIVKWLGTGVLTVGVVAILVFGEAPVQLILIANALTLFAFPLIAVSMLYLANNRSRMGMLRNNWWQNTIGLVALLLILFGAVQLAMELFG